MVSYVTTTPGAIMGVNVIDGSPRTISNLIWDISLNNPAALQAAQDFAAQLGDGYTAFSSNPTGLILPGADGVFGTLDDAWGGGAGRAFLVTEVQVARSWLTQDVEALDGIGAQ